MSQSSSSKLQNSRFIPICQQCYHSVYLGPFVLPSPHLHTHHSFSPTNHITSITTVKTVALPPQSSAPPQQCARSKYHSSESFLFPSASRPGEMLTPATATAKWRTGLTAKNSVCSKPAPIGHLVNLSRREKHFICAQLGAGQRIACRPST